jgi:hypothetical protein
MQWQEQKKAAGMVSRDFFVEIGSASNVVSLHALTNRHHRSFSFSSLDCLPSLALAHALQPYLSPTLLPTTYYLLLLLLLLLSLLLPIAAAAVAVLFTHPPCCSPTL